MKTIENINFHGERVIVRVDFNVPFDNNKITDKTRIDASRETINLILNRGGSVILITHIGRPNGYQKDLSCELIVNAVSEVFEREIIFCRSIIGKEAEKMAKSLKPGQIMLMENVRFYPEEVNGDIEFAKHLSKLGTAYVNDAFGSIHRAHASTAIIAKFFSKKYCGKLLDREVSAIEKVLKNGKKPILAVLGGAKISTKITIIKSLMNSVTDILIGGGMAYTFIKALGGSIGDSICEDDFCEYSIQILERAKQKNVRIHLPEDVIIADAFNNDANRKISKINKIPVGWQGLDFGPESLKIIKPIIINSKTILWNGPLGVFEFDNFSKGTIELGNLVAEATSNGSFSLVGGGDSVLAVKKFGFKNKMSYVSTGGGAMLECLEGAVLPGIRALS